MCPESHIPSASAGLLCSRVLKPVIISFTTMKNQSGFQILGGQRHPVVHFFVCFVFIFRIFLRCTSVLRQCHFFISTISYKLSDQITVCILIRPTSSMHDRFPAAFQWCACRPHPPDRNEVEGGAAGGGGAGGVSMAGIITSQNTRGPLSSATATQN